MPQVCSITLCSSHFLLWVAIYFPYFSFICSGFSSLLLEVFPLVYHNNIPHPATEAIQISHSSNKGKNKFLVPPSVCARCKANKEPIRSISATTGQICGVLSFPAFLSRAELDFVYTPICWSLAQHPIPFCNHFALFPTFLHLAKHLLFHFLCSLAIPLGNFSAVCNSFSSLLLHFSKPLFLTCLLLCCFVEQQMNVEFGLVLVGVVFALVPVSTLVRTHCHNCLFNYL